MPATDFKPNQIAPEVPAMLRELLGKPEPDSLTLEVRHLRRELEALRRDLLPSSTTILTGRDVVAEFKRLTGVA